AREDAPALAAGLGAAAGLAKPFALAALLGTVEALLAAAPAPRAAGAEELRRMVSGLLAPSREARELARRIREAARRPLGWMHAIEQGAGARRRSPCPAAARPRRRGGAASAIPGA